MSTKKPGSRFEKQIESFSNTDNLPEDQAFNDLDTNINGEVVRRKSAIWALSIVGVVLMVIVIIIFQNLCTNVWFIRLLRIPNICNGSGSSNINLPSAQNDRDGQLLSINGTTLSLTNGGSIDLSVFLSSPGPQGAAGADGNSGIDGTPGLTGPAGPVVLTNVLTLTQVGGITSTVNGVAGNQAINNAAPANLIGFDGAGNPVYDSVGNVLAANTTVSNNTVGNTLSTTVNGVVGAGVPIINSNAVLLDQATGLTTTVNGIAANQPVPNVALAQIFGFDALGNASYESVGNVLANNTTNTATWDQATGITSTVNGVAANIAVANGSVANFVGYDGLGNPVYELVSALLTNNTTNTLVNDGINTLTSTVNGVADSDDIINSNVFSLTQATGFSSDINGIVSNQAVPAGTLAQILGFDGAGNPAFEDPSTFLNGNTTNLLGWTLGAGLTSTVNGIAATVTTPAGAIVNLLGYDAGGAPINELPATFLNTNTTNTLVNDGTNTLTSTVNGVVSSDNIINSVANTWNALTSEITTTVNGVPSVATAITCPNAAPGDFFCQNGNSFGATGVLGTNDANALNLETNGTTRFSLAAGASTLTGQGATLLNSTGTMTINSAGASALVVQSGTTGPATFDSGTTGAVNVGTGANAKAITIGSGTGATSLRLNAGTGAINIGTNAVAHPTTIGNGTGASSVVVNCGTGACSFGANATVHTTTVGSVTGASATTVRSGTGALLLTSTTTGAVTLDSGTTGAVNIGNGASAKTITIGNATGATAVNLTAGTGNFNVLANTIITGSETVRNASATDDRIITQAAAVGAASFNGTLTNIDLSAARTYSLPDGSGTIAVSATGPITLNAVTGDIACPTCLVGGGAIFTVAGDLGVNQTISQGDTLTLIGGGGLTTTGSATDNITFDVGAGNGIVVNANDIAINSPTCAAGEYLQWNGTAFVCTLTTVSNTSLVNALSTTVNGVTGATVPIINSNVFTFDQATGFTSTVNGVASNQAIAAGSIVQVLGFDAGGTPIFETPAAFLTANTTNTLVNNGTNTLTSTVNGVVSSDVIVNTVANTWNAATSELTTTVNGVASPATTITCPNVAPGDFFCQNGNSYGATAVLGTNDAFDLTFETNATTWATLNTIGEWGFNGAPNAGKVASFYGDVNITGVIDPTALLFSDQVPSSYSPAANNGYRIGVTGAIQRTIFVSPLTDSTEIFQIRDTTNTAFFSADSTNGRIGVGTVAPGNTVEIDSGVADTSGLRFSNLINTSPTTPTTSILGVDINGDVVNADGSSLSSIICPGSVTIFCQNGNSFGADGVLGTNDAFDLQVETNGTNALLIDTQGNLVPNKNGLADPVFVGSQGNFVTQTAQALPGSSTFNNSNNNHIFTESALLTNSDENIGWVKAGSLTDSDYNLAFFGNSTVTNGTGLVGQFLGSNVSTSSNLIGQYNFSTVTNSVGVIGLLGGVTLSDSAGSILGSSGGTISNADGSLVFSNGTTTDVALSTIVGGGIGGNINSNTILSSDLRGTGYDADIVSYSSVYGVEFAGLTDIDNVLLSSVFTQNSNIDNIDSSTLYASGGANSNVTGSFVNNSGGTLDTVSNSSIYGLTGIGTLTIDDITNSDMHVTIGDYDNISVSDIATFSSSLNGISYSTVQGSTLTAVTTPNSYSVVSGSNSTFDGNDYATLTLQNSTVTSSDFSGISAINSTVTNSAASNIRVSNSSIDAAVGSTVVGGNININTVFVGTSDIKGSNITVTGGASRSTIQGTNINTSGLVSNSSIIGLNVTSTGTVNNSVINGNSLTIAGANAQDYLAGTTATLTDVNRSVGIANNATLTNVGGFVGTAGNGTTLTNSDILVGNFNATTVTGSSEIFGGIGGGTITNSGELFVNTDGGSDLVSTFGFSGNIESTDINSLLYGAGTLHFSNIDSSGAIYGQHILSDVDSSGGLFGLFGDGCDNGGGTCPLYGTQYDITDVSGLHGETQYANITSSNRNFAILRADDPTVFVSDMTLSDRNVINSNNTDITNLDQSLLLANGTGLAPTTFTNGFRNLIVADSSTFNTINNTLSFTTSNSTLDNIGHSMITGSTVDLDGLDHSLFIGDNTSITDAGAGAFDYSFIGASSGGAINTRINFRGDDSWVNLSGGEFGIGTNTPDRKLTVIASSTVAGNGVGYFENTGGNNTSDGVVIRAGSNAGTGAQHLLFQRPDGTVIGSVSQTAANAVAYNTTSDERLKTNITDSIYGLDTILKIGVHDYVYKDDLHGTQQTGFIAQELHKLFPGAVTVGGEDAKTNPWQVDYSKLTPLLAKGIQDLDGKVLAIDTRVSALEKDIAELKAGGSGTSLDVLTTLAKANAVNINGKLTINGLVLVKGTLELTGDNTGKATVPAGDSKVHVTYTRAFENTPNTTVTPTTTSKSSFSVQNQTTTGFDIVIDPSSTEPITFNYHSF